MTSDDLRQVPLLAELPPEELERLAAVFRERRIPAGSFAVHAEEPGPSIMFIAAGHVRISLMSEAGREVVLAYLGAGEFFGEIAVLTGADRSANAIAQSDCRLFLIDAAPFEAHISQQNYLSRLILRELALRLRGASTRIAEFALLDVPARLARTLASLAKGNGHEPLVLERRPTHQELASLVGTSREMITRALKQLEEDGCVRALGRRVEIVRMPDDAS